MAQEGQTIAQLVDDYINETATGGVNGVLAVGAAYGAGHLAGKAIEGSELFAFSLVGWGIALTTLRGMSAFSFGKPSIRRPVGRAVGLYFGAKHAFLLASSIIAAPALDEHHHDFGEQEPNTTWAVNQSPTAPRIQNKVI